MIEYEGGVVETHVGADPALGVDVSESVPPGEVWRLAGGRIAVTETGGVNPVTPTILIKDGSNNVLLEIEAPQVAAGGSSVISLVAGGVLGSQGGTDVIPIPVGLLLDAGWTIETVTSGSGTADYGAPVLAVEKFDR